MSKKKPAPAKPNKFVGLAAASTSAATNNINSPLGVGKDEKLSPAPAGMSEEDEPDGVGVTGKGAKIDYGVSPGPVPAAAILNGPTVAGSQWDNLPIRSVFFSPFPLIWVYHVSYRTDSASAYT
jgi:hypothetical protein